MPVDTNNGNDQSMFTTVLVKILSLGGDSDSLHLRRTDHRGEGTVSERHLQTPPRRIIPPERIDSLPENRYEYETNMYGNHARKKSHNNSETSFHQLPNIESNPESLESKGLGFSKLRSFMNRLCCCIPRDKSHLAD